MDQAAWAGVEWAAGELRVWLFQGTAEGKAITVPYQGDPVAALRAVLHPLLPPDAALDVIATGWPGTPPVQVPCRPPALLPARAIDPRLTLHQLPGLMQQRPTDLMGSAATRIAGHLARDPDFDGVLCLPGWQTAWAHVSAGEIVSFRSFLTGELLSAMTKAPGADGPGFAQAVEAALSRPAALAAEMASVRARLALGLIAQADAAAQMAGLLVGAELSAARPWWLGQPVTVIGDGWLADRYAEALAAQGLAPRGADPTRALLDGFRAAFRCL